MSPPGPRCSPQPKLPPKQSIKIRIYHESSDISVRKKMQGIHDRLKVEGFSGAEFVNLGRKGLSAEDQRRRFIADTRLCDCKIQKHQVYYPKQLAPYIDELRPIFGKSHDFIERPEKCRQREAEGDACDLVIDWIGLPSSVGR